MPPALDWLADLYASYGYPVLFLIVFLENAGLPVPGETAVLSAGFLASPVGQGRFHLGWVIVVAFLAAVLGDNFGYWVGRRVARPRLQRGRALLFLTPQRLARAETYFHRYGLATIFVARFVTGLRVIAAPAAGASGMPWPRFLSAQVAGAVAWSTSMGLIGFYFGHAWQQLEHWMGVGAWALLGTLLVVFVIWKLVQWHRHRTSVPALLKEGGGAPATEQRDAPG
jgi:membrane-associated protein